MRVTATAIMLVAGFSSSVAAQSSATGDAARGAQIYQASCGSCHSINANRVGPAHRGVVGRRAGTMAGYNYSAALRASRIIWDARTIDRFLQDPQKMIPGTKMGFRLTDPARRTDVIAYLRQQSRPVPK
jgi:cytochrome c